ncbi:uncharacterized protein LOC143913385 [Arctopsyche grandis]|uniref:uncharacterized protein LOC143913385 n=1 Tax=Arctopsyche grandis TaxID=121162 RepID=UPI00406D82BD
MEETYKQPNRINPRLPNASIKLVGSAVGHHGTYAFFKALKISRGVKEQIIAIGDFFFVRLWQDSDLIALGELQLLWTDRGAERTLASLRLYFLPENTPAGRAHHGEDEVVAISERVVIRAEDLVSWVCDGKGWRWGLRAAFAGDCTPVPPAASPSPIAPPPLPTSIKLDFSDVDKEKSLLVDPADAGVVVFSYPRYCRYRAMVRRLDGIAEHWLHDPLVAALGGYAAPTKNTRILYCRETFEYPELEGHEFVCNHMAPRLRGRAARGRRRRARSTSHSSASDSSASHNRASTPQGLKVTLRSSVSSPASTPAPSPAASAASRAEERAFMQRLRLFHKSNNSSMTKVPTLSTKQLNIQQLYDAVVKDGGYDEVTKNRGWKKILTVLNATSTSNVTLARRYYERLLLPFEKSERNSSSISIATSNTNSNGTWSSSTSTPVKSERKKHLTHNSIPIATIDISDSPVREISNSASETSTIPRLRTPPPGKRKTHDSKRSHQVNGEKNNSDSNRKKSYNLSMDGGEVRNSFEGKIRTQSENGTGCDGKFNKDENEDSDDQQPENSYDPSNILKFHLQNDDDNKDEKDYIDVTKSAGDLNQEFLDSLPKADVESDQQSRNSISVIPPERLMISEPPLQGLLSMTAATMNGSSSLPHIDKVSQVRSRPSSLRSVRVKPDRRQGATGTSPPASIAAPPLIPAAPPSTGPPSDDEIIEVPYRPKSPEIIDLDLYESPDSPLSAKRKKLDILKRGGLEVTTVHGAFPSLDPALQQQIWNRAQILQMYGAFPPGGQINGTSPPKVVQGKSIYGSSSPEKTVYGNPKDQFMPPPHVLQGATPRKIACSQRSSSVDILDLTIKPAVEIMRVAGGAEQPQNLTAKKIPNVSNETRQINPALEITLVAKNKPPRVPQKRSATGKFMSNKSCPTSMYSNPQNMGSPQIQMSRNQNNLTPTKMNFHHQAANLVIPSYQVSNAAGLGNVSPIPNSNPVGTNITSSLLQGTGGTLLQMASSSAKSSAGLGGMPFQPILDNSLYVNALYSTLCTGQLAPGLSDQHQLALYKELISERLMGRYPGIVTPPGVIATPTSKS